jgi:hypothetical protein
MTVELVLILGLYGFILLGAFLGPMGPVEVFKKSGPRLAARVERNVSVGDGFRVSNDGVGVNWVKPDSSVVDAEE